MVEEYPPRSVPVRLRDLPQTSARTPATMPWAEPRPLYSWTSSPTSRSEEALHPVLHVVGQGVTGGAGPVRLPEGSAAARRRCACGGSGPRR